MELVTALDPHNNVVTPPQTDWRANNNITTNATGKELASVREAGATTCEKKGDVDNNTDVLYIHWTLSGAPSVLSAALCDSDGGVNFYTDQP